MKALKKEPVIHISYPEFMDVLLSNNKALPPVPNNEIFYVPLETSFANHPKLGTGTIKSCQIRGNISINVTKFDLVGDTHIENVFEEPMVGFHFILGGEARIDLGKRNDFYRFVRKGECSMSIIPSGAMNYELKKKDNEDLYFVAALFPYTAFIEFAKEYLEYLPSEVKSSLINSANFFQFVCSIDSELSYSLNNLLINNLEGTDQLLYAESKATEFILYFIRHLVKTATMDNLLDANQDELDVVYKQLSKEYTNPPSIQELAKMSAMSQTKFYESFTQRYDKTPYQFIKDLKLDNAMELLKNDHMTVADVAYHVGYDSPEGFSRAFKNKFKINPKDFNSN